MTSPDGDRERYLDAVLIGGREQVTIVIAEPDDTWPARFAELKRRVEHALSSTALSVEHIGSTSVPGLAAKPIVDMLLTVASVDDEAAYVAALEAAGFVLRVREPGHRLFRTPERDMRLHVYEPGDQAVQDYLDLRDWLRESESDRSLYAATKRELAQHELREVPAGNRERVLAVRTTPAQERFVSTVRYSLEEAAANPQSNPWFRAEGAGELLTSCVPGEGGPAGFYARLGFVPRGDLDPSGEVILRLPLQV